MVVKTQSDTCTVSVTITLNVPEMMLLKTHSEHTLQAIEKWDRNDEVDNQAHIVKNYALDFANFFKKVIPFDEMLDIAKLEKELFVIEPTDKTK